MITGYISPSTLEHIVYDKLKKLGITEKDYPLDPFKLIENENIILNEYKFDEPCIKGMLVHGPNCSGIMINQKRAKVSKRFIAMHELFHYWFHPHNDRMVCIDEYTDSHKGLEWQANNGASYALMPKKLVRQKYNEFQGSFYKLRDFFQVSEECLEYRLDELNLVTFKVRKEPMLSYSLLDELYGEYGLYLAKY